jgi:predicted small lipoprotein YifL
MRYNRGMKNISLTLLVLFILAASMTACGAAGAVTGPIEGQPTQDLNVASDASPSPVVNLPTSTLGEVVPSLPAASATNPAPTITETAGETASPTPPESSATPEPESNPGLVQGTALPGRDSQAIIVDRHSVELFEQIPEEYLAAARQLQMVYADRSVGVNIDEGLNCLTAPAWAQAPAYCRNDYYDTTGTTWLNKTYTLADFQAGQAPSLVSFVPDAQKYDRSNWEFVIVDGAWEEIVQQFAEQVVPAYSDRKQVFSYQFNYFHVGQGSNIADPQEGFFVDLPREGTYINRQRWDISDFEALEAQYPGAIFFHWTTSLARSVGSAEGEAFNDQMRAYAVANDKILFDVADILSHDEQGQPCYDNRDGVEYCNNNRCENHPDDSLNHLAICQEYTTETDGGHLGSVSGGRLRVAKAFWVLMARIAGWEG